jgi:hypothetical protein
MHLWISQNKTINSFVGHWQGIWKISGAVTFVPQWISFEWTSFFKFCDGKDPKSMCTTLGFHLLCRDGFEPPVTEG